MQLKTNSNNLLKGLQKTVGVIKPNQVLPIIDDFKLELVGNELSITTTDLENTITTKLEVLGGNDGVICVPHKTILELLKTFNNESIEINSHSSGILEIVSEQGEYEIAYDDAKDFPTTHKEVEQALYNTGNMIDSNELQKVISKTLFATGNDELRPIMNGIYFDNGKIVATDAHKLIKVLTTINANFILPKKSAQLLKSLLPKDEDVVLQYNDTNALFSFDNTTLICRLVDGKYPNYEVVIPKENPNKLSIERELFISVLKRLQVFSNKTTNQVRLDLNQYETLISSEDIDFNNKAKETLDAVYSGEDMSIGVNSKFLIEMLSNINSEEITLDMSTPNRAILVNGELDVVGLVMPVMLNAK